MHQKNPIESEIGQLHDRVKSPEKEPFTEKQTLCQICISAKSSPLHHYYYYYLLVTATAVCPGSMIESFPCGSDDLADPKYASLPCVRKDSIIRVEEHLFGLSL